MLLCAYVVALGMSSPFHSYNGNRVPITMWESGGNFIQLFRLESWVPQIPQSLTHGMWSPMTLSGFFKEKKKWMCSQTNSIQDFQESPRSPSSLSTINLFNPQYPWAETSFPLQNITAVQQTFARSRYLQGSYQIYWEWGMICWYNDGTNGVSQVVKIFIYIIDISAYIIIIIIIDGALHIRDVKLLSWACLRFNEPERAHPIRLRYLDRTECSNFFLYSRILGR